MATFRYEGFDQLGKAKRGTVEAGDQQAALTGIRSQGVNPTRVEPVLSKAPVNAGFDNFRLLDSAPAPMEVAAPTLPTPRRVAPKLDDSFGAPNIEVPAPLPIPGTTSSRPNPGTSAAVGLARQPLLRANAKDLALFYQNMASLVNAGTSLGEALRSMSQAAPSRGLRRACDQMQQRVMTGAQMSELMWAYPGIFSPLQSGIIAAGERGGFLVASFERLASYSDRDYELQTMVKRETWYPKLVAAVTPILSPPALVALVMQGTHAWWLLMEPVVVKVAIFAVIYYALVLAKPFIPLDNPIKAVWDRVRLYVPLVGKVVRGLSTAKFCRSYGALYAAGVGPGEAIRISAIACGNLAIGKDAVKQIPNIERGVQLTEALRQTHHFPPLALQMMQIGEQSGDIDIALGKAADFLEKDSETTIRKAVPVMGIAMFVFVALFLVLPQLMGAVSNYGAQLDNLSNPDAK